MEENKIIEKKEFLKLIENETENIKERLITEYDIFLSYLDGRSYNDEIIKEYIHSRMEGAFTYYQKVNKIFNIEKIFSIMEINIKDIMNSLKFDKSLNRAFCTKDFILDVPMMNPSDKFILLFYFWGIRDIRDQILRELKVRDIDLLERTIKLKDTVIHIKDDRELKIINDTLTTDVYITAKGIQPKRCSLSDNSPYLLRVKRTENTDDGKTPLSYNAVRVRIQKVNEELGTNFSKNSLRLSGIADRLYNECNINGYWDAEKLKEWKENKYKDTFSINDVLCILNELYYK